VLKHRKFVHLSVQGSGLPDRPTGYSIPFDDGIEKLLTFYSTYLERRDVQTYDVLIQRVYGLLHILRCTFDTKI
jgi:hypothetical protein